MMRWIGRILAAGLPWALLLAAPSRSGACTIQTGDFDKNGQPDIKFLQDATITVNVSPTSTAVTGCGTKTFTVNFGTYFFARQRTINFNVTGTWVGLHKAIQIQSGLGVNKITIGGSGALTAGSSLTVEMASMSGNDTVAYVLPSMDASYFESRIFLNAGADAVIVKADNPITNGSIVKLDSDLGGDNNIYKFSQTALLDGTLDVFVLGNIGSDSGTFSLGGPIGPGGRVWFRTSLGAGNDKFDGLVSLPSFSIAAGGEAHVDVIGGAGDDVLLLSRKGSLAGVGTAVAGLLDIRFDGAAGNDAIGVDLAGGGFILDGTIRVREDGGIGNDTTNAAIDVQATSATPNLDVVLFGGSGTDKLTATINALGPNGAGNYGPAGAIILDGGLEAGDNCSSVGNGLVHERNCEL